MARGQRVRISDRRVVTIPAEKVARFESVEGELHTLYSGPERVHEYRAARAAAADYLASAGAAPAARVIRSAARGNGASEQVVQSWSGRLAELLSPYAARLVRARRDVEAATAAARTLAVLVADDGLPESATAQWFEIDRQTLRRWRGKNDRSAR